MTTNSPDERPPHVQLIQMGRAYIASRVVYAAAKLGIADHLASGAKSAEDLAGPIQAHAPSLHRLMRTLAGLGILSEQPGKRFALTTLGQALKTAAPGSARSAIMFTGSPTAQMGWDNLVYSVQTGKPGFDKAHGMGLFDYLAKHPDEASLFSEMMAGNHSQEPAAVAEAYDFSTFETIVDVGGASGSMLATVLGKYPGPQGILFDRPHVVRDSPALLKSKGVADRVTIEPGDFFQRVPRAADAYILSHVLHDWSEEQNLTILRHIREAMRSDGRLLIVEIVITAGDAPHPGKMLDMVMLQQTGGEERSEAEYADLLKKAGFRLSRVVPTSSFASIVEAVIV